MSTITQTDLGNLSGMDEAGVCSLVQKAFKDSSEVRVTYHAKNHVFYAARDATYSITSALQRAANLDFFGRDEPDNAIGR
jgi:hypothetical protein